MFSQLYTKRGRAESFEAHRSAWPPASRLSHCVDHPKDSRHHARIRTSRRVFWRTGNTHISLGFLT